jgi:hypothetical protein
VSFSSGTFDQHEALGDDSSDDFLTRRRSPSVWKYQKQPLTTGFAKTCSSSLQLGLSLRKDNDAALMSRAEDGFSEMTNES